MKVLLESNNMNYNITYMETYEVKKISSLKDNSFIIISNVSQYVSWIDMITDIYNQIGCTFFDPKKENWNWFIDVMRDIWFWEKYNHKPVIRIIAWLYIFQRINPLFYAEIMSIILPTSVYWDKKIILIGESISISKI